MSGRLFGLFLAVVAIIVGVAVVSLFDDQAGPDDVTVSPSTGPTEPTEPANHGDVPEIDPKDVARPDRTTRVTEPTTREAVERGEYDPTATLVVAGHVTDARTGKPVAAADVEVLYPDGEEIEAAETDATGAYRIEISDGIPSQVVFRSWADGYATLAMPPRHVTGSRELTVDFALRGRFAIEGRVVSARDGTPIQGADIEIRSLLPSFASEWAGEETDENGFYRIEDIEDLPREGIDVFASSTDYSPKVAAGLSLESGQDVMRVDFVLYEALTIVGVVVSARDGSPIEDAEISAASPDPEFIEDGEDEVSDEDGSFALELDSIPYDGMFVLVSADDHSPVRIQNLPNPDNEGVIRVGKIALPLRTTLVGIVKNSLSGAAVSGGDVSVYSRHAPDREDGDYTDGELIDETGRFEIELELAPPGEAEVLVDADGYFPLRVPLTIPGGVLRHEVVYEVEPVVRLIGFVRRTVDQTPVAGARVRVLSGDEALDEELVVRAGANGAFQVELPSATARNLGIVIEYSNLRFSFGRLTDLPDANFEIRRDFTVDVPPLRRSGAPASRGEGGG